MRDIRKLLADIREDVELKIRHPFLMKNIPAPVIDEDKLLLIISILEQQGLSYGELKKYALTTMLIQIALDTHELVSNSSGATQNKQVLSERQLSVLAGDYYSGLYYKLLAEADDIPMIRTLAEGIKDVNENKMSLYQKDLDAAEHLVDSVKLIEGSLLIKLSNYIQASFWNELSSNFLLAKRLIAEKAQFIQAGNSLFFEALKKISFPRNENSLKELTAEQQLHLIMICDRYIEFSRRLVENGMKHLPGINDLLRSRFTVIFGEHQPLAKTLVEEG